MRTLLVALPVLGLGLDATAHASEPGKGQPATTGGDADGAKAFVGGYLAAFDRGDAAAVAAMIARDANGDFITAESARIWVGFDTLKAPLEEFFRLLENRKSTIRDLRVQMLAGGKVAVANFHLDYVGKHDGKAFATKGMRMTYVLEKRAGQWLLVSVHGSHPTSDS